jgi:cysteinyl-tRNA synthetase
MMAKVWMHNGFLQVEGEKMAKSVGNFVTIRELLREQKWPGEVLRLNMLRTHYRQPTDWTLAGLEESQKVLDRWYQAVSDVTDDDGTDPDQEFLDALGDDLNTPRAIARLHAIHSEIRESASGQAPIALKRKLRSAGRLIGLFQSDPQAWGRGGADVDEHRVNALIAARTAARKAKNFAESDRIRDELAAMGVVLKDNKDGTTSWEVGR